MVALKPGRLSKREQIWLGAAGMAVFLLAFDLAVVKPVAREFARLSLYSRVAARCLVRARQTVASREEVDRAYARLSARVPAAGGAEGDERAMLTEVERAAMAAAVTIGDSKTLEPRPDGYLRELSVEVRVRGRAADVMDFLYRLETSPQLLRVGRMELKPSDEAPDTDVEGSVVITRIVSV